MIGMQGKPKVGRVGLYDLERTCKRCGIVVAEMETHRCQEIAGAEILDGMYFIDTKEKA